MTDQKCPVCGSEEVSSSLAENASENEVEQTSDCARCGVEWVATYRLVRVVLTETAPQAQARC